MTALKKPVQRALTTRYGPLSIMLEPPNVIKVRAKGQRKWLSTTIDWLYCELQGANIRANSKGRRIRKRVLNKKSCRIRRDQQRGQ